MRHLLYIDPGTGSMLFTVIIGVVAALLFAVKGLFIKLKYFFSGGKAKAEAFKRAYKKGEIAVGAIIAT